MNSKPIALSRIRVTDTFWKTEMELVRNEVIPYQWKALNDEVEGAAPSYAMHNFRAAALVNERIRENPELARKFEYKGFEELPEDGVVQPDEHYGFVFQDTDFYKWVEAAAYQLQAKPDPELEKLADEAILLVQKAQMPDGYLDTYYSINGRDAAFTNLRDHHELYCFGHLTEAAVAYYEATGKTVLLQVAERFAACIQNCIGREEGKKHGYPGHEIAEMALVRLYEVTGKEVYLNLAKYFIDERGKSPCYFALEQPGKNQDYWNDEIPYSYYQAHKPVREQEEAMGHAVRATYLYSGMADVARITDDETLKQACRNLWESITREKMYVTAGIGGTHIGEAFSYPFDLQNDTAYSESCASIGLAFFARRMLEMEPKSCYADVMERAFYNGILSGIALDGKSFFYVNPLEVLPEACRTDKRVQHVKPVRQKWFGCACCPPNIARIFSSVGAYAYTENEDTLFVHMYLSSEYTKTVHGKDIPVSVEVLNDDSEKWTVRIKGTDAKGSGLGLALRKPDWCPELLLNGKKVSESELQDGYLYLADAFEKEETLELTLPTPVRFLQADTRVREDIGKTALLHGPFVYAAEEKDNGKNLHLLMVNPEGKTTFERVKIAGRDAFAICQEGVRLIPCEKKGLYYASGKREREAVTITYIPYYMWANRGLNEMSVWIREV